MAGHLDQPGCPEGVAIVQIDPEGPLVKEKRSPAAYLP